MSWCGRRSDARCNRGPRRSARIGDPTSAPDAAPVATCKETINSRRLVAFHVQIMRLSLRNGFSAGLSAKVPSIVMKGPPVRVRASASSPSRSAGTPVQLTCGLPPALLRTRSSVRSVLDWSPGPENGGSRRAAVLQGTTAVWHSARKAAFYPSRAGPAISELLFAARRPRRVAGGAGNAA